MRSIAIRRERGAMTPPSVRQNAPRAPCARARGRPSAAAGRQVGRPHLAARCIARAFIATSEQVRDERLFVWRRFARSTVRAHRLHHDGEVGTSTSVARGGGEKRAQRCCSGAVRARGRRQPDVYSVFSRQVRKVADNARRHPRTATQDREALASARGAGAGVLSTTSARRSRRTKMRVQRERPGVFTADGMCAYS